MEKACFVLALIGIAAVSFAGDLTVKSGNTYKNYVIMGAAPAGIKVFYNNGDGDRQVILPVEEFPEELRETATSLSIMQGKPLPRVNFFQAVLESMDSLYDEVVREGFAPVMQAWRKYAITLGKEVRVIGVGQGETFTGIAADIDEAGALLVDTETGRRRVMAGDVSIRESTGRK